MNILCHDGTDPAQDVGETSPDENNSRTKLLLHEARDDATNRTDDIVKRHWKIYL